MDLSELFALSSVVIALSAMGVAVWQGNLTRKPNRYSVNPKLQVNTDTRDGLLYTLENQGLGPAVIESFSIHYNDKVIENPYEEPYQKNFEELQVDPFEKMFNFEFHLPTKGTTYKAGFEKRLLQINPVIEEFYEKITQIIRNKINMKIRYTCMYGKDSMEVLVGGT